MCQFSGLSDPRYTKVIATLQRLLQPLLAQPKCARSWEESATSSSSRTPDVKIDERTYSDAEYKEILEKLRFKQMDVRLLTLKTAQAKTCKWLLKNGHYKDWTDRQMIDEHHGFFWIKGKPGTGKSTMMKFLFGEAKRTMKKSIVISFFFNARGSELEKSTTGLYRSLLLQLLEKSPQSRRVFDDYESSVLNTIKNTTDWSNELLQDLFTQALTNVGKQQVVCYIDALDECPEDDIREMISFLEGLGEIEKEVEFRVCFSSRHYPEISIRTGLQLVLESEESHKTDIALFIDARLNIGITGQAEDIKEEILRKSSNIFLWVALVVPILNKEFDRGRIKALKKRLGEIPLGLHDLFLDILTRDQRNMDELLVCIQSMLFCTRPFKPEELQIAVEIGCNLDQASDQIQMTADNLRKFVLDTSKGLAEITTARDPTVQFIHESVRDFLLREGGLQQLFPHVNDFEARGHDTLKKICSEQVKSQWEGSPLRYYAVQNLLLHADRAQQGGADQSAFLSAFDTGAWVIAGGGGEQNHIIYHLAESGCANLIRIHPETPDHLKLHGGRYFYPLVASLYAGHYNAVRALVDLPSLCDETSKVRVNPRGTSRMDKRRHSAKRHIYTYLCEFGDLEVLKAVLVTSEAGKMGGSEKDSLRRQCFEFASTEGVLELILEFLPPYTSRCELAGDIQHRALFGLPPAKERLVVERFPDLPFLISTLHQDPSLLHLDQYWGKATSLISYAAEKYFKEIVELCLQDKSYVKTPDAFDVLCCTILSGTSHKDRLVIIRLLLDAGVDLGAAQKSRPGLLHDALNRPNNEDVFELLLSTPNVNIEETFKSNGTPLLMATRDHRRSTFAKMLLEAGANPMARDTDGNAALALVLKSHGNHILSQLILSNPRCVASAQNYDGQTALSYAPIRGSVLTSELIHREDIDPNSKDKFGQTCLTHTIRSLGVNFFSNDRHLDGVDVLLSSPKVDPNLPSEDGLTPLQITFLLFQDPNKADFKDNNWRISRLLLLTGKVQPPYPYEQPYPPSFPAKLVTLVDCFHRCRAEDNMAELKSLEWSHPKNSTGISNR